MKKIIYRLSIATLLLVFLLIAYLSTLGIKTKKFNTQIISYIQKIEPDFELRINEVSAKLNIFTLAIDAKTVGTNLIYRDKIIKLEHIKSVISIKSILKINLPYLNFTLNKIHTYKRFNGFYKTV